MQILREQTPEEGDVEKKRIEEGRTVFRSWYRDIYIWTGLHLFGFVLFIVDFVNIRRILERNMLPVFVFWFRVWSDCYLSLCVQDTENNMKNKTDLLRWFLSEWNIVNNLEFELHKKGKIIWIDNGL